MKPRALPVTRHINLCYKKGHRTVSRLCSHDLNIKNFFDLDLIIRSNSKKFLNLISRYYGMFLLPDMQEYYRRNFRLREGVCIDIFFDNRRTDDFLEALFVLERRIKYDFFWGRFIILHGSCVRYNNFNIFFLGMATSGKSTMCSALREKGGKVLSEDLSFLEKDTGDAYMFPSIGNIRPGIKIGIQEKYLKSIRERYVGTFLTKEMISMKKKDYDSLLSYHKALYGVDKSLLKDEHGKNTNLFILLKKDRKQGKGGILLHKKGIEVLPELMQNVASNYQHYSKLVKESMSIFLKSECYVLHRAPLDLMISEVCNRFNIKI